MCIVTEGDIFVVRRRIQELVCPRMISNVQLLFPQNLISARYVGYALTTQWDGKDHSKLQMIGFDMGGTSTDVSRYAGSYEHVFESSTAGATSMPSSDNPRAVE